MCIVQCASIGYYYCTNETKIWKNNYKCVYANHNSFDFDIEYMIVAVDFIFFFQNNTMELIFP